MTPRRKLIEVALPLEDINRESAREKSIRYGHPSTMHLWWARRPLAACRAVVFAQLVDDPSSYPDRFPTETTQKVERERLFRIMRALVRWEATADPDVVEAAHAEILASTGGDLPTIYDPFAGGGSIPLEAQRLGLPTVAADLNPVAVILTKAAVELPARFRYYSAVNPDDRAAALPKASSLGLAADVRYYGKWLAEEAKRRIGHLYPRSTQYPSATVIAWLWARVVRCPNPACGTDAPLIRTFRLAKRRGDNDVWVLPQVDRAAKKVSFSIHVGTVPADQLTALDAGTCFVNDREKKVKATFRCLVCESSVIKGEYVDAQARLGKLAVRPLAMVMEAPGTRRFYTLPEEQLMRTVGEAVRMRDDPAIAERLPTASSNGTFASNAQGRRYGFETFADYFTPRQQVALSTFGDLIEAVRDQIRADAVGVDSEDDGVALSDGGTHATAYADAVAAYLALAVSRCSDYWSSLVTWASDGEFVRDTFTVPGIQMAWDFAEVNPFSDASGNWNGALDWVSRAIERLPGSAAAAVIHHDATAKPPVDSPVVVVTDPPYYYNVSYALLSDFFYVWLRRSAQAIFPNLFATLVTPKSGELVATPFGERRDKTSARHAFEAGLGQAFRQMHACQDPAYPMTVFYAFKQEETVANGDGTTGVFSTGWETMLEGLLGAGFAITGTWPVRTERGARMVSMGTNALASAIVLVCRPRSSTVSITDRKGFVAALRRELPRAIRVLQEGNVAPVDLAQAAIGPGMAVFTRHAKVIESDGTSMRVRSALGLINQVLDEVLAEQEGEFDPDTRWAIGWFAQYGFDTGPYGVAETLSRARNTSVEGLADAGIAWAQGGRVALIAPDSLPDPWAPENERRLTVWASTMHLIHELEAHGESGAAQLLGKLGGVAEPARDLAYRLFSVSERRSWASNAFAFNSLVAAWPQLVLLAAAVGTGPAQQWLLDDA